MHIIEDNILNIYINTMEEVCNSSIINTIWTHYLHKIFNNLPIIVMRATDYTGVITDNNWFNYNYDSSEYTCVEFITKFGNERANIELKNKINESILDLQNLLQG